MFSQASPLAYRRKLTGDLPTARERRGPLPVFPHRAVVPENAAEEHVATRLKGQGQQDHPFAPPTLTWALLFMRYCSHGPERSKKKTFMVL